MCSWPVFWPDQITCDHKTVGPTAGGWRQHILDKTAHKSKISNKTGADWRFGKHVEKQSN